MLLQKTILGLLATFFTLAATAIDLRQLELPTTGLTGLRVGPTAPSLAQPLLRAFSSDGCSLSPNGLPFGNAEWVDCCTAHDLKYWLGGTRDDRENADQDLKQCIAEKGYSEVAAAYFLGVRVGGQPDSQVTFRWGYGWNKIRPYSPLTSAEIQQSEFFYGKDLRKLRTLISRHQVDIRLKLNVYDSGVNHTNAAEIAIYRHLRTFLRQDQIVVKAMTVNMLNANKVYVIYLSRCPQTPLRYFVNADQSIEFKSKDLIGCASN